MNDDRISDGNSPKPPPAPRTEMIIYRICWVTVFVAMLASLFSSSLGAYLAANESHKIIFYVVAAALIGISVWMRLRIKKATGQLPTW